MLPPLKLECHCSQCQSYVLSMLNYVQHYGSYPYSDHLSPIWAGQPMCEGSCGTHGDCGRCDHCDEVECDCTCDKCGNCGSLADYCECCACGAEYYCDDCEECGGTSCQCACASYGSSDARFGSIKTAPWVDRGVTVEPLGYLPSSEKVREMWDVDASIDICQSAADFYLLEAMSEAGGGIYSDQQVRADATLNYLRHEARQLLGQHIERLDSTFQGYLDMIIGGELRHHRAAGKSTLRGSRREAWSEWKAIRDAGGLSVLSDAVNLFEDFNSTGYGGTAWANIARLLLARKQGAISARLFVDRVWSAEHNGGSLFDKGQWSVSNSMGWHYGMLGQYVLPAHGAMNPFPILLLIASDEVRELFSEMWKQANATRRVMGHAPIRFPVRPPMRRSYYGEKYLDPSELSDAGMLGTVHA